MKSRYLFGAVCSFAIAALVATMPSAAGAQSVSTRTPNLSGGWTAPKGVIQLNFLHRFSISEAPLRKIQNTPTFNVGTGITDNLMVGFVYGSNSALVQAYPNEWEFYARALPVTQAAGAPVDVSVQAGYNVASESVDGEVLLARDFGRLRLLGAGRAFSEAYDSTAARFAVTGGAVVRLTPSISLAADFGSLLDRADDERTVWGAGVQFGVPYTPHSFSIHASNVGTQSLEGASRGTSTRWGFEYTIPISVRRYVPRGAPAAKPMDDMMDEPMDDDMGSAMDEPMDEMAEPMSEMAGEMDDDMMADMMSDTVVVDIKNLKYAMETVEVAPGTTVVWRNLDPVQHSITAKDGSFDSGLIDPQQNYAMTFRTEGSYPFICTPHPFMTGSVVVRKMMDDMDAGMSDGMSDGGVN